MIVSTIFDMIMTDVLFMHKKNEFVVVEDLRNHLTTTSAQDKPKKSATLDKVATQATSSELPRQSIKTIEYRWLDDNEHRRECRRCVVQGFVAEHGGVH